MKLKFIFLTLLTLAFLNSCGALNTEQNTANDPKRFTSNDLVGFWRESHIELKRENPRQLKVVEESQQRLFLFDQNSMNIFDPVSKKLLCPTGDQQFSVVRNTVIHLEAYSNCTSQDWNAQQLALTQFNIDQDVTVDGNQVFASVAITKTDSTQVLKSLYCADLKQGTSSKLLNSFCK